MRTVALLAVVCAASAQAPVVGEINFYGLRKVTPERVLSTLHLKQGESLPPSRGDLEDALENIPGVVLGRVEAVCCEGNQAALFIGVEERGGPHASLRTPPTGEATLPQDLVDTYAQFVKAVQRAAARGNTAEDLSAGQSMMDAPEVRELQLQFVAFATAHLDQLRDVLRNSADSDQRAIAATVIGYSPKKKEIIDDLQYALQDPDDPVRANAIRSLKAVAVLAAKQPALGIRVSATWFVEMLNSIVLSDRVESAKALLILTDQGGETALDQIRERALPALADMARWRTPRYALPPFLLLGRVAGMTDDQVQKSWQSGDREAVIDKALNTAKKGGG